MKLRAKRATAKKTLPPRRGGNCIPSLPPQAALHLPRSGNFIRAERDFMSGRSPRLHLPRSGNFIRAERDFIPR
jgi:hypothetical protein